MEMTFKEWKKKYGWIFPVKPEDKFDIHNMWTLVSNDEDDGEHLCGGFHPVNSLETYATRNPWGIEEGDDYIDIIPTENEIEFRKCMKAENDKGD